MLKAKSIKGKHNHFSDLDVYDKAQIVLSYIMRLIMLGLIIFAAVTQDWFELVLIVAFFILTFVPSILEKSYKISVPLEFNFVFLVFVFLGFVIGDIKGTYAVFPWWDNVLHMVSGVGLGLLGFVVVWILIRYSEGAKLDAALAVLFSFSFAIMMGTLWEFLEFAITQSGLYVMQHSLVDTMTDLVYDAIGALIASFFCWLYVTERRRVAFISRILRKIVAKTR